MSSINPGLLEALADIKELRKRVLDHQLFCGYSGLARIAGGVTALVGSIILLQSCIPPTPKAHIIGWGIICAISAIVNFCALVLWWRRYDTELAHLRPALDLVAPFIVGGLITFSLLVYSQYDLLFPIWMWLFGIMNISSRHSMPKIMTYLGWYYIIAGAICVLSLPFTAFTNPLPMGIVFFIGEVVGGLIFINLRQEEV